MGVCRSGQGQTRLRVGIACSQQAQSEHTQDGARSSFDFHLVDGSVSAGVEQEGIRGAVQTHKDGIVAQDEMLE